MPHIDGVENYDIIPEIEKCLGYKLSDNTITLYLIYFAKPYGVKISGTQYITDISNGIKTIMGNAIHEMMHPPFRNENPSLIAAQAKLQEDEFLKKIYRAKRFLWLSDV